MKGLVLVGKIVIWSGQEGKVIFGQDIEGYNVFGKLWGAVWNKVEAGRIGKVEFLIMILVEKRMNDRADCIAQEK